jgi:hypothetical protein
MSTLSTILKLSKCAHAGISLGDKCLAFLLSGLGVMGNHREYLRALFLKMIALFARKNTISLRFILNKKDVNIALRLGNKGDYLMTGELVRGGVHFAKFLSQSNCGWRSKYWGFCNPSQKLLS